MAMPSVVDYDEPGEMGFVLRIVLAAEAFDRQLFDRRARPIDLAIDPRCVTLVRRCSIPLLFADAAEDRFGLIDDSDSIGELDPIVVEYDMDRTESNCDEVHGKVGRSHLVSFLMKRGLG